MFEFMFKFTFLCFYLYLNLVDLSYVWALNILLTFSYGRSLDEAS